MFNNATCFCNLYNYLYLTVKYVLCSTMFNNAACFCNLYNYLYWPSNATIYFTQQCSTMLHVSVICIIICIDSKNWLCSTMFNNAACFWNLYNYLYWPSKTNIYFTQQCSTMLHVSVICIIIYIDRQIFIVFNNVQQCCIFLNLYNSLYWPSNTTIYFTQQCSTMLHVSVICIIIYINC